MHFNITQVTGRALQPSFFLFDLGGGSSLALQNSVVYTPCNQLQDYINNRFIVSFEAADWDTVGMGTCKLGEEAFLSWEHMLASLCPCPLRPAHNACVCAVPHHNVWGWPAG